MRLRTTGDAAECRGVVAAEPFSGLGLLAAGVIIVAWFVTDGFYFGERPYASCVGDPATCARASRYVSDHWPAIAP
jgi:hypothetical protein